MIEFGKASQILLFTHRSCRRISDVFEYELNNPMALYGSIPYMLAHNEHDGTVGVYLNNAAEMWIDISNSVTDKGVMSKVGIFNDWLAVR